MKPTDQTLLQQLKITDREIDRRLGYLHLSDENKKLMATLKPIIAADVDRLVHEFYSEMISYDEVTAIIGDAESLARLKNFLTHYILDLFDGDYGHDYVQTRLRIGLVHKRIGVPPKLYIMAVNILIRLLRELLISQGDNKSCQLCNHELDVLEKVILFDLTLVIDTYIHGLLNEVERGRNELESYAQALEEKVAERTRELIEMARFDGLTSLYNQRSFYEELRREHSRARRLGESLSLIYFDLDKFKLINDTQGHKKGDEILIETAKVIREAIRREDIPARYGGDEFCIILPHTDVKSSEELANRLIKCFDDHLSDSGVTLSIGISVINPDAPIDVDTLVKEADAAMYQSKEISGNAIHIA